MSGKNRAKYTKIDLELSGGPLTLYAGHRVLSTLEEIVKDMTLYSVIVCPSESLAGGWESLSVNM